MSKATYQGFVDFVKSQPADKEINHRRGWNFCSVGDYYHSIGESVPLQFLPENNSDSFAKENPRLFHELEHPRIAALKFPTYGDLAAAL